MGKSNRTHQAPPVIENLGDGSFYYNFDVVEKSIEDEVDSGVQYDYNQVRCHYPIDEDIIQACLDREGYDHIVNLDGYEAV